MAACLHRSPDAGQGRRGNFGPDWEGGRVNAADGTSAEPTRARGRPRNRVARRTQSVSMADVARVAGVSSQTVSRVSNGFPGVNEETRRQVLAAMKELDY